MFFPLNFQFAWVRILHRVQSSYSCFRVSMSVQTNFFVVLLSRFIGSAHVPLPCLTNTPTQLYLNTHCEACTGTLFNYLVILSLYLVLLPCPVPSPHSYPIQLTHKPVHSCLSNFAQLCTTTCLSCLLLHPLLQPCPTTLSQSCMVTLIHSLLTTQACQSLARPHRINKRKTRVLNKVRYSYM